MATLRGGLPALLALCGGVEISGRRVTALTLEHYPGMTEKALAAIAAAAEKRFALSGVTVVHRVGRLLPGQRIVFVGAASAHRQAALEAVAFLIDWLKTSAPFWKLEEYDTGETAWVPAREPDAAAAATWNALAPKTR